VWVFTVPIFQSPDEACHLDYALHIYDRGGPYRVHAAAGDPADPLIAYHPSVEYLIEATRFHYVRGRAEKRVEADYGTRDYFRRLDAGAPEDAEVSGTAWVSFFYPYGYYTLLAGWIAVVQLVAPSLVVTFFAARLFSVALLTVGLVLVYRTARGLRVPIGLALGLTAAVGWFPLTSFVASYIQPDNLAFVLVTLCAHLGIRLRQGAGGRTFAALGLALGLLLVTKPHFFACALAPLAALGLVEVWRNWPPFATAFRSALLLGLPSVVLGVIHVWVMSGAPNTYLSKAHVVPRMPSAVAVGLRDALHEYLAGRSFQSFWGTFGHMDTPLVYRDVPKTDAVNFLLQAASYVLIALALVRAEQVFSRLIRLARRGRWRTAGRLVTFDPWLNGLIVFTGFMVGLYTLFGNIHGAQGRNWFPCLPALLLTALVYAPQALTLRRARRFVTLALMSGFLAYALVANHYALRTLRIRFYPPRTSDQPYPRLDEPMARREVPIRPVGATMHPCAEGVWEGPGRDSFIIFRLDRPRHVYGIELEYTFATPGSLSSRLTWFRSSWWLKTGPTAATNTGQSFFQHFPGPQPRRVVVWVNEVIDEFRFDPGDQPFRFGLLRLNVLDKPADDGHVGLVLPPSDD
jgi:hypothetical protein